MLFGHQNDDTKSAAQATTDDVDKTFTAPANVTLPDSLASVNLPAVPDELVTDSTPAASALNQTPSMDPLAPPTLPAIPTPDILQNPPVPAINTIVEPHTPASGPAPSADLLELKQQALEQLGPLVGHLDQSPEEKFRTTMMMIQSSDNQGLIQTAYDAAQAITDEKARAQALLDIVNEINYFTQKATNA